VRQLLRRMDAGEAVQIASLPDAALRAQLEELFVHLRLRKTLQARWPAQPRTSAPTAASLRSHLQVSRFRTACPRPYTRSAAAYCFDTPEPSSGLPFKRCVHTDTNMTLSVPLPCSVY